jgi:hypothetical protein
VFASPAGLVKVTKEAGPLRVRGKFVDGSGEYETRNYKGKCVVTVEAAKDADGEVELIVVPVGSASEADAIRRTIAVKSGKSPIPPPDPVDPVKPDEPVDPLKTFRIIFINESSDQQRPEDRAIMTGKVVEDWMIANCTGGRAGFRRFDKDITADDDKPFAALWAAVKPVVTVVPCVAMERNGKVKIVNLEATPAKMIEVFEAYRGK